VGEQEGRRVRAGKGESAPCTGCGIERRRFAKWTVGALLAMMGGGFAWSFIATIVSGIFRRSPGGFSRVEGFESMPLGRPQRVGFPYTAEDAYLRQDLRHFVWIIRHSATSATVFSPICPHLGCRFDWQPEANLFACPCHGSVFSITGKVLAGPAPRPLDTLPSKVADGVLYVEWERFKVGTREKTRA